MANVETVEREVEHLRKVLTRIGKQQDDGTVTVTYGVLFDDEEGQDYFEALMGTLKAARKRGVIDFKGQMLLKGNKEHENTVITLLKPIEA